MNSSIYTPPLKRRRVSLNSSPRSVPFNNVSHLSATNRMPSHLNAYTPHPSNNTNCNEIQTDPQNGHLPSFKSQLQQILELFPPFVELISFQMNPNQVFDDLYDVFRACPPQDSPAFLFQPTPHCAAQEQPPPSPSHLNCMRLTSGCHNNNNNNNEPHSHCNHNKCIHSHTHTPCKSISIPPCHHPSSYVHYMEDRDRGNHSWANANPACIEMFVSAKEQMMQKVYRNMDLRCNKIMQSLNKTTKNNAKCCALLKQFTMNTQVKKDITHFMSEILRTWRGGKPLGRATSLNKQEAFKLVRGHWNRQKAQQLGDTLFCLVLQNIFEIVLQISELEWKDQVLFYIELFSGLLSDLIQFEQSMPRPVVPHACFDKSLGFKQLCENILEAFSSGTLHMVHVQTTETFEENGKKVTKYVRHGNRSKVLAESYCNSLQDMKAMILKASDDFIQHSIQIHLNWLRESRYRPFQLIEWEPMDQEVELMPLPYAGIPLLQRPQSRSYPCEKH